jgi:ParB family chromosome partitioning protein
MTDIKKPVLGRGLSSLFNPSDEENQSFNEGDPYMVSLESIDPGVQQPRQAFVEEELSALASSIKEKGVLQPILIRPHPQKSGKYEIVAGERRWRAAKKVGLDQIPALIKEFTDAEALEVGLLENIQRQDLNPIEEAEGYRRLAEEFSHTQESLSRILGKSRSHIANVLRLLTLPANVKNHLAQGKLSASHGRALINSDNPEYLADLIVKRGLSVRQAEILAKQKLIQNDSGSTPSHADPEKEILRQHISDLLGRPIDLVLRGLGGRIVISFKNPADLDQLLQRLNSDKSQTSSGAALSIWSS